MKKFLIRKRNGKTRLIYKPNHRRKTRLRLLVPELNALARDLCDPRVVHGFMPGKSPVTNALEHVGFQWTLCCDLADFFDSVTAKHLPILPQEILEEILVDGAARQGLPTSPAAANLAAGKLDRAILRWIARSPAEIRYTRYADDLSFSSDQLHVLTRLRAVLPRIVKRSGFTLNESKTRILSARAGRRIITGVAVDDSIHAPRTVRRRLRAARHQGNWRSARGLAEWDKLKLPSGEARLDGPVVRARARALSRTRFRQLLHVWEK